MENAGLITFRDDLLLLDGANASVAQRRSNAAVICHELAHMWFGDLVTMAWWDDLWLNESFADWMAAKVTDEVVPQYKDGLADLQRVQTVRQSDTQPSTQPIRDRTTSATAGLANVGLVYSKGNAVLSMFERYLGPETFRKGVQSYLKSHAWGNATAADLWHALDQSSGTNVSAAMTTFLDQPGVPYVRVVPVEGGVRLTQSRATPYGVSEPAMKWKVPVTLKWSDGKTVRSQRVLLADESMVVRLPARPVWVMPNGEGRGYYAWSVPDEWMAALAEHAGDVLTPEERVAFLGNLSLLMTAGEVHGDTYLKALSYFGRDPEPQVVSSTLEALQGVRAALVPDSPPSLFALCVRRTLSPALERVGYDRRPGEDETVSTMRGDLLRWLASRGQDDKVMAFAQSAAAHYLADSTSVDPGIADAVVSLAAKHGDAAMFADYQRRLESTDVPAVRRRFLAALGGFEDPALVTKALDYMLSDKVRPTETFVIMQGLGGRDEATGERMFRWMIDHYDQLATRIPPPALRFLPMMGAGCSAERLAATEAFFTDPKHSMPGGEKTLERVSDMVHTCRSVREREGERVTTFMRAFAINWSRTPRRSRQDDERAGHALLRVGVDVAPELELARLGGREPHPACARAPLAHALRHRCLGDREVVRDEERTVVDHELHRPPGVDHDAIGLEVEAVEIQGHHLDAGRIRGGFHRGHGTLEPRGTATRQQERDRGDDVKRSHGASVAIEFSWRAVAVGRRARRGPGMLPRSACGSSADLAGTAQSAGVARCSESPSPGAAKRPKGRYVRPNVSGDVR